MRKIRFLSALSLLTITMTTTGLSQAAHADSGWMAILKPIVSEIALPMVNQSLNTLKTKLGQTDTTTSSSSTTTSTSSSSSGTSWDDEWKLPEEPSH